MGNLFVDGFDGSKWGLSELPEGEVALSRSSTLDQSVGATGPSTVGWCNTYLRNPRRVVDPNFAVCPMLWLDSNSPWGQTRLKVLGSPGRCVCPGFIRVSVELPMLLTGQLVKDYRHSGNDPKGTSTKRIMQFGDFRQEAVYLQRCNCQRRAQPLMNTSTPIRYSLSIVAAMLAGCGGSQPPIGAPGAMPQTSGDRNARRSWQVVDAAGSEERGLTLRRGRGCGNYRLFLRSVAAQVCRPVGGTAIR